MCRRTRLLPFCAWALLLLYKFTLFIICDIIILHRLCQNPKWMIVCYNNIVIVLKCNSTKTGRIHAIISPFDFFRFNAELTQFSAFPHSHFSEILGNIGIHWVFFHSKNQFYSLFLFFHLLIVKILVLFWWLFNSSIEQRNNTRPIGTSYLFN